MFKKFNLTCDEATTICDKSQYKEASFFEILRLNWHFLQCKICRLYTKQNNKMSSLFSIKSADCKQHKNCLTKTDKEQLAIELKKMRV